MENIDRIFEKYDELENECFEGLVEFMLKCPNNSWNIDLTIMSSDFIPHECKRMWYSREDSDVFVGDKTQKVYVPVTELKYGEMARILSSLPNEQMLEKFEKLHDIISNYNVQGLLSDYPYFYENEYYGAIQIIDINDFVNKAIKLDCLKIGGDKVCLNFALGDWVVTDLLAHLNKAIMLCSDQYKTIKNFLDLQENLNLDINTPLTMNWGGTTFNVVSIDTTDDKGFMIHGVIGVNTTDTTNICVDALTLKPQDLDVVVEYLNIDVRNEIIGMLQNLFNDNNAYAIADSIIDDVIAETKDVGDMREALNIVLMRKMGLKI